MEPELEKVLNLLLESERAGVAALDRIITRVENDELKRLLTTSREDESATVQELERLIRTAGGIPSQQTGQFASKVAGAGTLSEQLKLLVRGEEWMARKIEEALMLASGNAPIQDYLQRMARRHRFEVEWGRADYESRGRAV